MIKPALLCAVLSLSMVREVSAQPRWTVRQNGDVVLYTSRDGQTICRNYPFLAQNTRRSASIAITRYLQLGGSDERTWTRVRSLSPTEVELAVQGFEMCMDYLDGVTTRNEYLAQRRTLAQLRTRLGLAAMREGAPPITPIPSGSGTPQYRLYRDPTYAFTVYYPAHLLAPQGEAVTGNGETFLSSNGAAKMRVYGVPAAFNEMQTAHAQARQRIRTVTYDDTGPAWFVVSGYDADGRIIYEYHAWRDGVRRVLVFQFSESMRRTIEVPLEIVQRSFRQAPLR
jgi:hypothetical protein